MPRKAKQTISVVYAQRQQAIAQLVSRLLALLETHRQQASAAGLRWHHVGDLTEVQHGSPGRWCFWKEPAGKAKRPIGSFMRSLELSY